MSYIGIALEFVCKNVLEAGAKIDAFVLLFGHNPSHMKVSGMFTEVKSDDLVFANGKYLPLIKVGRRGNRLNRTLTIIVDGEQIEVLPNAEFRLMLIA